MPARKARSPSRSRPRAARKPGVRELAAQATRDSLLRAATKIFAKYGLSGASVEKISKAAKSYDRMMDSKNADVKNMGGRWGGACTAAAFLKRFIKEDVAWAHLDIAGTAMDAPKSEINTSWGSGWGVQLLDRFVAENFEKAEK